MRHKVTIYSLSPRLAGHRIQATVPVAIPALAGGVREPDLHLESDGLVSAVGLSDGLVEDRLSQWVMNRLESWRQQIEGRSGGSWSSEVAFNVLGNH